MLKNDGKHHDLERQQHVKAPQRWHAARSQKEVEYRSEQRNNDRDGAKR